MSKEEILKATRNHSGEIKTMLILLESSLSAAVSGNVVDDEDFIDSLKGAMGCGKDKFDELSTLLDGWPHQ